MTNTIRSIHWPVESESTPKDPLVRYQLHESVRKDEYVKLLVWPPTSKNLSFHSAVQQISYYSSASDRVIHNIVVTRNKIYINVEMYEDYYPF